jgi:hypothetical protein
MTPPEGLRWDSLGWAAGRLSGTYDPWEGYGCSKLANIAHAAELQRRSEANNWGITSASVYPGAILGTGLSHFVTIGTGVRLMVAYPRLWRFMLSSPRPLTKTVRQGVATTVAAALLPSLTPGAYYSDCAPVPPGNAFLSPLGHDPAFGSRLWEVAQTLTRPGAKAEGHVDGNVGE